MPKVEVLSEVATGSPVDFGDIDAQSAQAALDKLIADHRFHASDRNRRFLRFVVEQVLAGHADRIKSYSIAVDVFGRGADFDPAIDPIVRIEATRLRSALASYYADPGRGEAIQIRLPRGGYVPSFVRVSPPMEDLPGAGANDAPDDLKGDEKVGPSGRWRTALLGLVALLAVMAAGVAFYTRYWPAPVASATPIIFLHAAQAEPPEARQIATGFTKSLGLALSRYDGVRVIQLPPDLPVSTALSKLGIDSAAQERALYILDSSVRQEEPTIRFWWALKDAQTGETMWTDVADRSYAKGMTMPVEDEIASKLATVIGQPQGLIATHQIGYERSQPTEGYGCVLRARAYYLAISEKLHAEVRDCLEKTVAIAPDYAEAWAMLAFIYLDEDRNSFNRRSTAEDALQRAVSSAQRAAELAPRSETAQQALLGVYYRKGDFDAAFVAGRRALEINPHNPELMSTLGVRLFARGEWDEGADLVRRSMQDVLVVPPLDRITIVFDLYRKGDYRAALEQAQLIDLPDYYFAPVLLAAINGQLGNLGDAQKNIDALLLLRPDYAREMRNELRSRHYTEAFIDMLADGLQKAGLPML
jgi:adenylate cyclase